jgi:hypothetical protein
MGLDTIPQRLDGQSIDQTWFNTIRSVLDGDLCPRTPDGAISDQAGNLGSSSLRWLYAYGLASNFYNSSRSVQVKASSGMPSNYSILFPSSLPGASGTITSFDASGNLKNIISPDNSTLDINSGTLRVKPGGITRAKLSAANVALSSSSGTFSPSSSNVFLDIPNLSVTLQSFGRPIFIALISDGSGTDSTISVLIQNTNFRIQFARNNGSGFVTAGTILSGAASNYNVTCPSSSYWMIDVQPAGTYNYKTQLSQDVASGSSIKATKLIAFEL